MKNLILSFLIFFFAGLAVLVFNMGNPQKVSAVSTQTYFARVMADNVYLYRNAIDNNDYSNIYFELPRTFFVELVDEYDSNFYVARYLDIDGYVKKDCVTAIEGTPEMPFLTTVCFRVYSEQSQDMRKLPTGAGGAEYQEYFLPQDNLNITYIGKILGEPLINKRSNVWYYCKFMDSTAHYGYVYGEFCDDGEGNELIIPTNKEEVIYIANPSFAKTEEPSTSLPVESKTTWIVIAILSVPALIFILMFLKGGKVLKKDKKLPNKEVKDY